MSCGHVSLYSFVAIPATTAASPSLTSARAVVVRTRLTAPFTPFDPFSSTASLCRPWTWSEKHKIWLWVKRKKHASNPNISMYMCKPGSPSSISVSFILAISVPFSSSTIIVSGAFSGSIVTISRWTHLSVFLHYITLMIHPVDWA